MNTKLPQKIKDYVSYAHTAQKHFDSGFYSDTALNCRKACEAICKVIIYNAYTEKLADTKVEGCKLKELIIIVIKDGLAERKIINWIESLQIIGNKSAHDAIVSKDEATYSLNALHLLTDWLFNVLLNIKIPKELDFDEIKPTLLVKPSEPTIVEKIIVQEKISKETEESIINRIQSSIDKKNNEKNEQTKADADTITELKKSVSEANEKINIINSASTQTEFGLKVNNKKTKKHTKWLAVIITCLGLVCSTLLIYSYTKSEHIVNLPITKNGDTIYVAINNFNVLQDNPNINFKIETILNTYIEKLVATTQLPIKVNYTQFKQSNSINDTAVINEAERLGYDAIFIGNMYETALSDSNLIEINGTLCKSSNRISRTKKISFKNLTDSTLIKEFNDQSNLMAIYIASSSSNNTNVISVLNKTFSYSLENYICLRGFLLSFYLRESNYKSCLNELNKLIPLSPDPYYIAFKGGMFYELNVLDSSIIYTKKALAIDSNNVRALFNLAETYNKQHNNELTLTTLLKIIRIDPLHEVANFDISTMYYNDDKVALAKKHALIVHQINPQNKQNNFFLAEYYGYTEKKADSAQYFYNLLLKNDSNNVEGLNSLANYYLKYFPEKKDVAKILLTKAKSLSVISNTNNLFGMGISAFKDGDFQKCIFYLEQVCNANGFNNDVSKAMTNSYFALKNFDKAYVYAKKGMAYDSNNISNQYNHVILVTLLEPKNVSKATYYFKKILKAYPNDLKTIFEYARYLNKQEKYADAITLALPYYKFNKSDVDLNQHLADAYIGLGDFKSALNYAEYVHIVNPNSYENKRRLAYVIFYSCKGNKDQMARGNSIIRDAILINPNDGECHLIAAYYMFGIYTISKSENRVEQMMQSKKNVIKEYNLAKQLDKRILDKGIEDFIK